MSWLQAMEEGPHCLGRIQKPEEICSDLGVLPRWDILMSSASQ